MGESLKTPMIPLWTAIVVILALLTGSGATIASAFVARGSNDHAAITTAMESTAGSVAKLEIAGSDRESRLRNVEKLLERVVANQEYLTKIVDRLEAGK